MLGNILVPCNFLNFMIMITPHFFIIIVLVNYRWYFINADDDDLSDIVILLIFVVEYEAYLFSLLKCVNVVGEDTGFSLYALILPS